MSTPSRPSRPKSQPQESIARLLMAEPAACSSASVAVISENSPSASQ